MMSGKMTISQLPLCIHGVADQLCNFCMMERNQNANMQHYLSSLQEFINIPRSTSSGLGIPVYLPTSSGKNKKLLLLL